MKHDKFELFKEITDDVHAVLDMHMRASNTEQMHIYYKAQLSIFALSYCLANLYVMIKLCDEEHFNDLKKRSEELIQMVIDDKLSLMRKMKGTE